MIRAASYVCIPLIFHLFPLHPSSPSPSNKQSTDKTSIISLPDYDNPSSYTHDLTTSSDPSDPSFPLLLAPYRKYSPCELRLEHPHDNSQSVTSVALFISQNTNASTPGVTWSVDNQAPKVAVDAGVATAETGSARMHRSGVDGGMWAFVGAVAAATVLL